MNVISSDGPGRFGIFGGQFVPETLMPGLQELEQVYLQAQNEPSFQAELANLLADYSGRPTPLYRAANLENALGCRAKIYLKREDLNHTGAHKINNCLGQVLLTKRMGKKRIVAEQGHHDDQQHQRNGDQDQEVANLYHHLLKMAALF